MPWFPDGPESVSPAVLKLVSDAADYCDGLRFAPDACVMR